MGDGILECQGERIRGDVGRQQADVAGVAAAAALGRDRDRDRAAAGANVPDEDRRRARRPGSGAEQRAKTIESKVDERLRLGARYQRPLIDAQGQPVELLQAAQIGDRPTKFTLLQKGVVGSRLRGGDDCLRGRQQGRAIDFQDVAQEDLGVKSGSVGTGRVETRGRDAQQRTDRRRRGPAIRHSQAPPSMWASSWAWSMELSSSSSRSRSPSRTLGRLWRSMLMRWSVTRSWGKL